MKHETAHTVGVIYSGWNHKLIRTKQQNLPIGKRPEKISLPEYKHYRQKNISSNVHYINLLENQTVKASEVPRIRLKELLRRIELKHKEDYYSSKLIIKGYISQMFNIFNLLKPKKKTYTPTQVQEMLNVGKTWLSEKSIRYGFRNKGEKHMYSEEEVVLLRKAKSLSEEAGYVFNNSSIKTL